jgi:hypothetical protein
MITLSVNTLCGLHYTIILEIFILIAAFIILGNGDGQESTWVPTLLRRNVMTLQQQHFAYGQLVNRHFEDTQSFWLTKEILFDWQTKSVDRQSLIDDKQLNFFFLFLLKCIILSFYRIFVCLDFVNTTTVVRILHRHIGLVLKMMPASIFCLYYQNIRK